MMFHIGQKVVCIVEGHWGDTDGLQADPSQPWPKKGAVYTIDGFSPWRGRLFLILSEFHPKYSWEARFFRPVIERKTDISVFKAMLNPTGRELERA